jgi:DNA-3-methyladenine glycosylase I
VELVEREGSVARYVWRFEPEPRPRLLDRESMRGLSQTDESKALARDLKRRGWRFVGPTTVYAFMQAMGLVNDHIAGCDAGKEAVTARERFQPPAG